MTKFLNFLTGAAALAAVAVASPAGAAPVFFDDFEANPVTALNTAPIGWNVTNGTVDIVKTGDGFGITCNPGTCIDLDGSTSDAGVLTTNTTFGAGNYVLSFDLSGNQRGGTSDSVQVLFGGTLLDTITVAPGDPFAAHSYNVSGPGAISFSNAGGDNVGAILDNVSLSTAAAVPEPGTLALLGSGLAAFGLLRRRWRAS